MVLKPNRNVLLDLYKKAVLLKKNDERIRKAIAAGKLIGPYYSTRGQELIPSAIALNLEPSDYICTTYRGIHDSVAKGLPLDALWSELAGRSGGTCKGKGGPMHITYPAAGIMVTTGIVGSSMPIANGLALAAQIRGEKKVAVANFGDGATNIGAFHEALNMAAIWKLPVIFVCQNNRYAEHTKFENGTSAKQVSDRAGSYGIPGVRVDGNDPAAMFAAAEQAVERARSGQGPTLLEAMTFRFHGHLVGDNDAYMDEGEKKRWMEKDPVPLLRTKLISDKLAAESDLAAYEEEIETVIEKAATAAFESPLPDVHELARDVFATELRQ